MHSDPLLASHIASIRRFNRLYTQRIQLLNEHTLDSDLSLPEARVLFEIAHSEPVTGAVLARSLGLDPGYMSRLVGRLFRHELLLRTPSPNDQRARQYSLSALGRQKFDTLDRASQMQIGRLLDELSPALEQQFVGAIDTLHDILAPLPENHAPIVLRTHEPGDMGWVIQRHGELYQREYGLNEAFEVLVARVAAEFLEKNDPQYERCWIAELNEQRVGCAFLVHASESDSSACPSARRMAKIRLELVDPKARGSGLGRRLIRECIRFASRCGYHCISLWTNSVLLAARHIYASEGFVLTDSEPHDRFGKPLIGETWQKNLR